MEAAIKVPSIQISGSLISVIWMVTMGPVDTIDRALCACSTLPHAKCPIDKIVVDIVGGHKGMLLSDAGRISRPSMAQNLRNLTDPRFFVKRSGIFITIDEEEFGEFTRYDFADICHDFHLQHIFFQVPSAQTLAQIMTWRYLILSYPSSFSLSNPQVTQTRQGKQIVLEYR